MQTPLKIGIVILLAIAVAAVVVAKQLGKTGSSAPPASPAPVAANADPVAQTPIPRLLDLGAKKCIPCKAMAPILENLKKEMAGRLQVDFIDVWENPNAAKTHDIQVIPTQIFYDAKGKELARHIGFINREDILAKFTELGVDLAQKTAAIRRETPLAPDTRPADAVCFMCDGDLAPKTRVTAKVDAGQRLFCSAHCFFIYESSLPDTQGIDDATQVADFATGKSLPAKTAVYLLSADQRKRPVIHAFDEQGAAKQADAAQILSFAALKVKEFSSRCAFCDRVCYPVDSCRVNVGQDQLHACCPNCAMGVAARLQKDIEVFATDPVDGQTVHVQTLTFSVVKLEPPTAVAWFGQKKNADGKMTSAGCFKQFFFANEQNLRKWLEQNPRAAGEMTSISQSLTSKMKMSQEQIRNACKIGDCAVK